MPYVDPKDWGLTPEEFDDMDRAIKSNARAWGRAVAEGAAAMGRWLRDSCYNVWQAVSGFLEGFWEKMREYFS